MRTLKEKLESLLKEVTEEERIVVRIHLHEGTYGPK